MKIQTFVNFKLNNGKVLMKGIHDDSDKDFPDEIMDEIEKARNNKMYKKLAILVDDKKRPVKIKEDVDTSEDEEDIVTTGVKKPARTRKIRK